MQVNDERYYPPVGFYFNVSLASASGLTGAAGGSNADNSFQEVSGLTAEVNTEEIEEGGENRFTYTVPGKKKYRNLVLKRGLISGDSEFGEWAIETMESTMSKAIEPKHIMVSLMDADGDPLCAWFFVSAWPVKAEVSEFNAMENKYVTETLEFTYLYYERFKGSNMSAALKMARKLQEK